MCYRLLFLNVSTFDPNLSVIFSYILKKKSTFEFPYSFPLNKIQFPIPFFFVVLAFHSVVHKAIFSTIWEVNGSAVIGCSYSTIPIRS